MLCVQGFECSKVQMLRVQSSNASRSRVQRFKSSNGQMVKCHEFIESSNNLTTFYSHLISHFSLLPTPYLFLLTPSLQLSNLYIPELHTAAMVL